MAAKQTRGRGVGKREEQGAGLGHVMPTEIRAASSGPRCACVTHHSTSTHGSPGSPLKAAP